MRIIQVRPLFPLIILIVCNWSTDQTTVDVSGLKKNRINFYGTLLTNNGETYKVENISVGRLYKQFDVYEKPLSNESALKDDPKKGIITKLDLSEIQEIRIPQPTKTWSFQRPDGSYKTEYVAIEVKQGNQINNYLIDTPRKLLCDQISPSGPIEKEVPFHALDRIIIIGYKQRDQSDQNNTDKKINTEKKEPCVCPPIQRNITN